MRLDDQRESSNYEVDSGRGGGFGLPIGIPLGRGGLGCGSIIFIIVISLVFGVNPLSLVGVAPDSGSQIERSTPGEAPGTTTAEMSLPRKILASTEDVWSKLFANQGGGYEPTTLRFYQGRDSMRGGCGFANAAAGPFYCPSDKRIFLDTDFFETLTGMGAPGDFAKAYVVAHEVGHHVQNLEGTLQKAHAAQQRLSEREANALQVKIELQADCYAGVWAAQAGNLLEPGDAEEGLRAAAAVGDDTIQKASQGTVVPEGFTHGSAADRQKWLKIGLDSGDPARCDTFGSAGP